MWKRPEFASKSVVLWFCVFWYSLISDSRRVLGLNFFPLRPYSNVFKTWQFGAIRTTTCWDRVSLNLSVKLKSHFLVFSGLTGVCTESYIRQEKRLKPKFFLRESQHEYYTSATRERLQAHGYLRSRVCHKTSQIQVKISDLHNLRACFARVPYQNPEELLKSYFPRLITSPLVSNERPKRVELILDPDHPGLPIPTNLLHITFSNSC